MNSISVELKSEVNRLRSQPHDAADAAAQRHHPSAAVRGLPASRDSWLPGEVITLRQIVVDEVLQEELIHVGQIGMTGNRPDVIYKEAHRPFAWLHQNDGGGTNAELTLPQDASPCRRRQQKLRPDSPDHFPPFRREKKCGLHVAESVDSLVWCGGGGCVGTECEVGTGGWRGL